MYDFIRRNFLSGDPEEMHSMALARLERMQSSAFGRALLSTVGGSPKSSPVQAMGMQFRHPVGLAAGFDKNASAILALQELGFSHVEVGTVTPRPQPGNPKPRIWRFAVSKLADPGRPG